MSLQTWRGTNASSPILIRVKKCDSYCLKACFSNTMCGVLDCSMLLIIFFKRTFPASSVKFSKPVSLRTRMRLVFWTDSVGENLRSTSGLVLGARTLLAMPTYGYLFTDYCRISKVLLINPCLELRVIKVRQGGFSVYRPESAKFRNLVSLCTNQSQLWSPILFFELTCVSEILAKQFPCACYRVSEIQQTSLNVRMPES